MADVALPMRHGTGLFIFVYNERRIVVSKPQSYAEALQVCQHQFCREVPAARISLHTRELDISPGELLEVTETAWDAVKEMVNRCEVMIDTAATAPGEPPNEARRTTADPLSQMTPGATEGAPHPSEPGPSTSTLKRPRTAEDNPFEIPCKKPRDTSPVLQYPSDGPSPAAGNLQPARQWLAAVADSIGDARPGSSEPEGSHDVAHVNGAGPSQPRKAHETTLTSSGITWTPRPSVPLPPPVLSYELFWSLVHDGSDMPLQLQRAMAARLYAHRSLAVLVYTNWAVVDNDVRVRKLMFQCTGRFDVQVVTIDDYATFHKKSKTDHFLAYVVLKSDAERAALLASSVWTAGALLIMLRSPTHSRTGLYRFFRVYPGQTSSEASTKRDIQEALDLDGTRLQASETVVRTYKRNEDQKCGTYDVMVCLQPDATVDHIAPELAQAYKMRFEPLKIKGRTLVLYPPRVCPLCQSGGHGWQDCILQRFLGPSPHGRGLWLPSTQKSGKSEA